MQYKSTHHRRVLSVAAAVVACLTSLAACSTGGNPGSPAANNAGNSSAAAGGGSDVSMMHYFSDAFGASAFKTIIPLCNQQSGKSIQNSPIGQEAFKDSILVQLAGGNPPDLFSYWAGAKTQSLVDGKRLASLDDFYTQNKISDVIPESLIKGAAQYGGTNYLLPFDYHYVAFFYNPSVMSKAGITTMPTTWDELLADAAKLKAAGITPFALGSKDQWEAQFWMDYMLLRTAGPDYRQKLMNGQAKYTDPEVKTVFTMWKDLFDKGYFNDNPNSIPYADAADLVANGKAAMTLMGTWVTGYWDGNKIPAGTGYNMFPFPTMTPGVPRAALGPVDGWAMSAAAHNQPGAQEVLKCLAGPDAQKAMALAEGALAPNKNADLSSQNAVMHAAAAEVQKADAFVFNYDLATPPEMSAPGLTALAQFVNDPSTMDQVLQQMQTAADEAFKK